MAIKPPFRKLPDLGVRSWECCALEPYLFVPPVNLLGLGLLLKGLHQSPVIDFLAGVKGVPVPKERGRNNFHNYASQLQATFVRSQIPKASK
jgi:hypothetical protein